MKFQWKVLTYTVCLALMVFAGAGCKHGGGDVELDAFDTTGGGSNTGNTGNEGGFSEGLNTGLDLESIYFDRDVNNPDRMQDVYFDFDSYSLRPDALDVLRANADKIKQIPGVIIQIAGHCDERGTSEYNFTLGERRALAVREHLMNLGVSGDRLITISYGEESPAAMGTGEAAWAQNRRCEFLKAQAL